MQKLLIVDDDEISLELLDNLLSRQGYEVLSATNGDQALEILRQGTCRLVISDWEMPGMSGLELCRQVRQAGFPHYLYMILLTSRDRREDIIEGLSAGADDFITKPYHPEELAVRVRAGQRVLGLETRDVMIFALAKLAESRDADTGAHLDRVRKYSRLLAEQLSRQERFRDEVTPEYVQLIYLTSPLHDIGKVAIPDCVLLKPGVLNDREFEVMKSHARLGAETLEATLEEHPEARFLQLARDIAATHHERYDGSGYPAGLRGDDIPLCGRIVALADVYDALTSKRCYKDSFEHDVARSIILEGSGVHFDPDVVDAFLAAGEAFAAISGEAQPALSR